MSHFFSEEKEAKDFFLEHAIFNGMFEGWDSKGTIVPLAEVWRCVASK